uniref:Uncharacterized protein n=1 Tax=Rhizophora mucronata TaxID=61149 RepID=A0A2P2PLR4_RHIMU
MRTILIYVYLFIAFSFTAILCRKAVELEKAKYFSEISNLSESGGADMESEKLSPTCGNALEEDRRKEFELATDYIIRRTLQTLPDGFDVDHLCCLLKLCANVFPFIAMDRSGSHVSETALKSLGTHLLEVKAFSVMEE